MQSLKIENIKKRYTKKNVLNDVSLEFTTGSIFAILGENGAGKSTLVSILSGNKKATEGQIIINEKIFEKGFNSVKQANEYKIRITHQHPTINDELTVYEYCLISNSRKNIKEKIKKIFEQWNFYIDINKKGRHLNASEKFYTELLSALISNPNFLILDEPTVFLTLKQRQNLYEAIKKKSNLKENKLCVILITHNIDEAKELCDKIIYLKKGNITNNFNFENHITLEIEKNKNQNFKIFKIENLNCDSKYLPHLFNINLFINKNSITTIIGKREDGIETLEEIICGVKEIKFSGKVFIHNNGFEKKINSYKLRKLPVGIIPSNRITRGANQELTIEEFLFPFNDENIFSTIKNANISCELTDKIKILSGGMLQRLILERELFLHSEILFLFEPDQGLDSLARYNLSKKLLEANSKGKTIIIFTSSGENELLKISDSIYKLEGGKISK
jgi:ABC-type uncharacterized transport system ATPase subunit